jgi:hypothetical protein
MWNERDIWLRHEERMMWLRHEAYVARLRRLCRPARRKKRRHLLIWLHQQMSGGQEHPA